MKKHMKKILTIMMTASLGLGMCFGAAAEESEKTENSVPADFPGEPPEDWSDYIDPDTGLCPLGDMAISLEQAIAQAKEFGHSTRREIGYLTIHSMLHLLGYDHMDDGPQKKQMRGREEAIAAKISRMQRN